MLWQTRYYTNMQFVRLSLIAIALLGCRDDAKPARGADSSSSSTSGARPRPQLDTKRPAEELAAHAAAHAGPAQDFESEPEDPAWATRMAAEIQTQVLGTQVRCKTRQCQVVIIATTAEDAIAKTEQLRALRKSDSEQPIAMWMPMPPANLANGSIEALVYARFER